MTSNLKLNLVEEVDENIVDSAALGLKLKGNDCILYWIVIMVQTIEWVLPSQRSCQCVCQALACVRCHV